MNKLVTHWSVSESTAQHIHGSTLFNLNIFKIYSKYILVIFFYIKVSVKILTFYSILTGCKLKPFSVFKKSVVIHYYILTRESNIK